MRRFLPLFPLLALLVVPAFAQDPTPDELTPAEMEGASTALEATPSVATAPLSDLLAQLAVDPIFATASVGLEVVDAETGVPVYGVGQDQKLVPASTMKLVTAAVALRELGPTYRFPTWIMADGAVDSAGVLNGNLYVKGQGDPTMVIERMYRVMMDLRLRGINEVRGNVVFDDGYFQDTVNIPGWPSSDDLVNGPTYFAPLGALSVNYNIASIIVRPGATVGSAAVAVAEVPSAAVVVENHVTTGSSRSRKWIKLERTLDEATGKVATYTLTGNVRVDDPVDTVFRALPDPLTNYIAAFESAAKSTGLKVKGAYKPGATPTDAKLVLRTDSEPLVDILAQMNKLSNNFMAEQILRSVGAEKYGLPGTTEKGVRAIGEYMTSLGVPADAYTVVNGSGLTRETKLRASALNAVLVDMYRSPAYATEFLTTLSVGGRDGTLKYRFREDGMEGRVRGKSGTLDGVRCLSGYVEGVDGRTYAFTFFVNDIQGAVARARSAHDRLVLTLSGTNANVADGEDAAE